MPRRRSAKRSTRRRSAKRSTRRRSTRRRSAKRSACRDWKWPWAFGAAKDAWEKLAKERVARNAESEKKRMVKNEQKYKRTKGVLQSSGFYV